MPLYSPCLNHLHLHFLLPVTPFSLSTFSHVLTSFPVLLPCIRSMIKALLLLFPRLSSLFLPFLLLSFVSLSFSLFPSRSPFFSLLGSLRSISYRSVRREKNYRITDTISDLRAISSPRNTSELAKCLFPIRYTVRWFTRD